MAFLPLVGVSVVLGAIIAFVDNVAFGGETSPIVIVALLLGATALVGAIGGTRAWGAAIAVWVWIPLAHLAKHVLGMPDTLHPNTYASIAALGGFSLAITVVGAACGLLVRRLARVR